MSALSEAHLRSQSRRAPERVSLSTALPSSSPAELLRVENLRVHFPRHDGKLLRRETGTVRAVDGVTFTLHQGEMLALVGPAGSGKTSVARAVALLEQPAGGRILFQDQDLTSLRGRAFKRARRPIQMLFSNPYSAFAPRMAVEAVLDEAISLADFRTKSERDQRIAALMAQVGLNLYLAVRFPRDLSPAYRQRLALARALAAEPAVLVCDGPAQYLDSAPGDALIELLADLNRRLGLAMLLTTTRLEQARHADRVAVLFQGRIVEMGYYRDLVRAPLHPFTLALLQRSRRAAPKAMDELDPSVAAPGCHYAPFCPVAEARCRASYPAFVQGAPHHGVACHLVEPLEK